MMKANAEATKEATEKLDKIKSEENQVKEIEKADKKVKDEAEKKEKEVKEEAPKATPPPELTKELDA